MRHHRLGETRRRYQVTKRAIDLIGSIAALVVLAPLLVAIAVLVTATSKGGPFFIQQRAGEDGRWFSMVKFRTMAAGAADAQASLEAQNELDGAVFAIRSDPRVTRVGRLLRRTSLDELPQLFNVLAADMSLVGPRPLPQRDFAMLRDQDRVRCSVRPGMTGLAQVRGRNDLSFDEMMACDSVYVQDRSVRLDLEILAETPKIVLLGTGAY